MTNHYKQKGKYIIKIEFLVHASYCVCSSLHFLNGWNSSAVIINIET